ncbi:tyrosine-type recombinase/integrase [Streptacidiphilus sp. EB103A]|uniref:tyrosine-type recombinase/integrase n=1 Tax=Streptacidiphilus sp. EB103A TaxID=3156275 RepID=UPI003518296A
MGITDFDHPCSSSHFLDRATAGRSRPSPKNPGRAAPSRAPSASLRDGLRPPWTGHPDPQEQLSNGRLRRSDAPSQVNGLQVGNRSEQVCPEPERGVAEFKYRHQRLAIQVQAAAEACPALLDKRVHPHVLRHSCAMSLLQAGVDTTVIALWLGHAGVRSTDAYVHADMTIKEQALALTAPVTARPGRYRPTDKVLAFLDRL